MEDARAKSARGRTPIPPTWRRLCWLALLAALLVAPPAAAQEEPAEVRDIELRREGGRLRLHFVLSRPTSYEVVGNPARRVVVVKFSNARPALADDRRQFAYNDPAVVGIAFERVGERDTWAKIRLRQPNMTHQVVSAVPAREMVLALERQERPERPVLAGLRLGVHRGGSRLVLDLSALPQFETGREADRFVVRLKGAVPRLTTPVQREDQRLAVLGVEQDGEDTLVRMELKRSGLEVASQTLPAPPRIVLDVRPAPERAARAPRRERPPRAPRVTEEVPLDVLLARAEERNPLISANYQLAERGFRAGNFARANTLFLRVFDTAPDSLLGIRAYFRAADAQYQRNVAAEATNYHATIATYQSAIRSAEQAGYETALIPHAIFQIGRSYQRMGFPFESNVHYEILQERFPENFPYTAESYYFQGLNHLRLREPEEGAAAFRTFLEGRGPPDLEAAAHYHLGDAYFELKRFVDARQQFDRGRKLDPDYAGTRPVLLFHMGETYYENAEFDVARVIYRELLERYPEKDYTKLVGLRLGDFLREEGKQEEALGIYRQVIEGAPEAVRLRGMMRIANLLANRPTGDDYVRALDLYDDVAEQGQGSEIAQQALLRKALTLMLHGRHQEAIDTFGRLAAEHPEGPYTRENLVDANIAENLKSRVNRLYAEDKFWEVAKVYTRYRDRYFDDFRFPVALVQVAHAYQQLGLYDEASGLYDEVLRRDVGGLASLVQTQKALAFLERDDLGRAEETLAEFIEQHPEDVYLTDARMLLGRVYFTGRRYEDALEVYSGLVQDFERTKEPRLGESISEVYFELGRIYKELGRFKEGLDSFQSAVANFHHPIQGEAVPEFIIRSHFLVGDMLFELGQDTEAIAAYEKAISLYAGHDQAPWARYQMGLIYRRMGEDRKALEEFNTLVELAEVRPGELWEPLARQNQRDLANKLQYRDYLQQ